MKIRKRLASPKCNSLAKQLSHDFRMTRHGVEGEGEAQTENCADEECTEDHFLFPVDFPRRSDEEIDCGAKESNAAEQMSPVTIAQ